MKAVIISLCGMFAGCGATLPKVVETPVPVPCISPDEKPMRPTLVTDGDLRRMSDYQMALALRQFHVNAGDYITELEAVVEGCSRLK